MTTMLAVLGALVLLVPVVLCFPLFYRLHASHYTNTTLVAGFSWSQIVTGKYELGQGLELRVLGLRKSLPNASRGQEEPSKPSAGKPRKKPKKKSLRLSIRVVLSIVRDALKHMKPQRIEGDVRIGFADPYYTGLLGVFLYVVPHPVGQVHVTPVYEDEVLEGWFLVEGRIIPAALLVIALRRLAPVILMHIRSKFRSNERKVEKHA